MAETQISQQELGKLLTDMGFLIGLLQGDSDSFTVNEAWFTDPVTNGFQQSFNWPHLKPVLEYALGVAENPLAKASDVLDEEWYAFKVADEETEESKDSPYYFVSKIVEDKTLALLGAGIYKKFTELGVDIQPFLFAPIFQMPNDDNPNGRPIFDLDENGPVEMGVQVQLPDDETIGGLNAFLLVASFDFATNDLDIIFKVKESRDGEYRSVDPYSMPEIINPFLTLQNIIDWLELEIIAGINVTWGALLYAIGFLESVAPPYKIPDLNLNLGDLKNYITQLFLEAFKSIFQLPDFPDIPEIPSESVTLYEHDSKDSISWKITLLIKDNRYGLGIQIKDIEVRKDPRVTLQFGAWTQDKTDWIKKAGGEEPAALGLNFWVLKTEGNNISFDPQFEATSIGLDIDRNNDQPLFNINDYAFKMAQTRGYFSSLEDNAWGAAASINNISLPLGPPSAGSVSDNPVASTLLESDDEEKPAVNPEFSFITAYVNDFYLQLFDKDGKETDVVDIPIQKTFGPVEIKTIGIGWKNSDLLLLFQLTGGLDLAGLALNLSKLSIGVPVTDPSDFSQYTLDLEGIGINFDASGVVINGGLLKNEKIVRIEGSDVAQVEYNGSVSIQAGTWGIGAIGSFAVLNNQPSMFVFGTLSKVLGGPAYFVVKGVSAGFGYNRNLILPELPQVKNYPLVKGAVDPTYFGSDDPAEALGQMSEFVPPRLGMYWLAAGVKFSSFELINSFALLAVAFGEKVEVSIIGTSTLVLPKPEANVEAKPYVNAEFQLLVVFTPDDGVLKASGLLTDNSYVIDKACKLSGGFAFYTWFKDQTDSNGLATARAGDFVLCLGGYHPNFEVPAWYPEVTRLGIDWKVDSKVTIAGEAYFALTPSCVMAGGKLELNYKDGNLKAWFTAWADFLISWNPFYYDIEIGISVGASYKLNLGFTTQKYSVSLGAVVNIWGPEFSGKAKISWWVISFTVNIGGNAEKDSVRTITWNEFKEYFLPLPDTDTSTQDKQTTAVLPEQNVLKINVNSGLDGYYDYNGIQYWVVDPGTFDFNIASNVPVSQISFPQQTTGAISCNPFGIRPLGSMVLEGSDSDMQLTITKTQDNGSSTAAVSLDNWVFETSPQSVPYALWGTINDGIETPSANSVENITLGISSATTQYPDYSGPPAFESILLAYTNIRNYNLPLSPGEFLDVKLDNQGSIRVISDTLMARKEERTAIFTALQGVGTIVDQDGNLQELAENANDLFSGSPMLNQEIPISEISAKATTQVEDQDTIPAAHNVRDRVRRFREKHQSLPQKSRTEKGKQETVPTSKSSHTLVGAIQQYHLGRQGGYSIGRMLRNGYKSRAVDQHFIQQAHKPGIASNGTNLDTISIAIGSTQIWDIQPTDTGSHLDYDGKTTLRLLAIDQHRRLIMDEHINAGKQGKISIPTEARQLILRASDQSLTASGIYGWHAKTQLIQPNPQTLIGNGVVLRGQSPNRIGRSYRSTALGSIRAGTFLKNNITRDKNGTNKAGWVRN